MGAYAIAVTASKVATIITTIMMRVSLLPDWNRWRKNRSTGDMSVLPSVLSFTNSYAVLFYAYAIDDYIPLFATTALGARVFVIFFFVSLAITIYAILALCGITDQSRSSVGTSLGFITIGTTTLLYASPMATIVRVVRTKTASSMPLTMGVVNVLNSFCWAVYGGLIHNMFLLAPNVVGVSLSAIRMTVTYIYRSKGPSEKQVISASNDIDEVVDVEVVQPDQDNRSDVADDHKSQGFVAMRSPSSRDSKP
ncbi:hypothetical protein PR003_g4124 [Phytophthora rubi]|uniref:Sugar transporter SWEET1 n=1 Tax=Phytophthora rubi TaxID=129364 RepID=A0A6A4FWV3_9STRA|nr:hypothetical protein PR003_g4124 [Phytophthora rubi]